MLRPRARSLNQVRDSGTGDSRQRLDDIDRKVTLLTRYVEEQIPRVVADSLRAQVTSLTGITHLDDSGPRAAVDPYDDGSIVREIAHSLNTPLAQIEASVLSMSGVSGEQRQKLDKILDGVRIAKSFLTAFREVATLTRDSHAWSPDSLGDALRTAVMIYADRSGHSPAVDVQMPKSVPGYSNSFIMAVLLPLLENAVEAAPAASTVSVRGESVGDGFRMHVCNDSAQSALPTDIYLAGFTTKHGHDGLGLPSVRPAAGMARRPHQPPE